MYSEYPSSYEKYLANLRLGQRDCAQGGVKSFTGFSPNNINGFALRCFYGEMGEQLIRDRLVTPIEQLAQETGVDIYPFSLWWPHTSTFTFVYVPKSTPGSSEEIQKRIDKDPRIAEITQSLVGTEIAFDYLWAGTTITAATSRIPTEVLEARRQLKQIATEMGMLDSDYANIYHISLARIAGISGDLKSFGKGLMRLHHAIYHNPLVATVTSANIYNDRQFADTYEAPLLESVRLHRS